MRGCRSRMSLRSSGLPPSVTRRTRRENAARSVDAAADRLLAGHAFGATLLHRGVDVGARAPGGAGRGMAGRDVKAAAVPGADRLAAASSCRSVCLLLAVAGVLFVRL